MTKRTRRVFRTKWTVFQKWDVTFDVAMVALAILLTVMNIVFANVWFLAISMPLIAVWVTILVVDVKRYRRLAILRFWDDVLYHHLHPQAEK